MGPAQPLLLTFVYPDMCTCVASVCIGYSDTHTHTPSFSYLRCDSSGRNRQKHLYPCTVVSGQPELPCVPVLPHGCHGDLHSGGSRKIATLWHPNSRQWGTEFTSSVSTLPPSFSRLLPFLFSPSSLLPSCSFSSFSSSCSLYLCTAHSLHNCHLKL